MGISLNLQVLPSYVGNTRRLYKIYSLAISPVLIKGCPIIVKWLKVSEKQQLLASGWIKFPEKMNHHPFLELRVVWRRH